jgi:sensor c-di-GMP phosphodiesterase-like protein
MDKKRIKENHIFRIVMIVLCIVIALVSNIVLAKNYSSPEYTVNKKTITYLDEKKTTALELCAGATALSAAITLIPGDTGTPIAEKLTDLSGYFLIVVSAIYLEKYLLTILGALTFRWLIPAAMIAIALYFGIRRDFFWKFGVKILIFGLAVYAVIPVSVHVSQLIYNTYQESIDTTLAETENLISQTEENAQSSTESDQNSGDEGFFAGLVDKAKDTIEQAKDTASIATEQFKYMLNKFIDGLAVLIVTTCLIPILVMVFFVWIVKMILGTAITQPAAMVPGITKKDSGNKE